MRTAKAAGAILAAIAAVLASVTVGAGVMSAGAAGLAVINCGSATVGPTATPAGKTGGALCFLHAYRNDCRPVTYSISRFGVDTIARDTFRLVKMQGRCRINVAVSFRVVPQEPHAVASGQCATLVRRSTDIVAGGCVGKGLPSSISLTGSH